MEKFITLDHLKKTAQSLILDTDSKINGLPTAARTGSYNDLSDKPEIPNIEQSDWNQNDDTADDYIQNRTHYSEEVDDYPWCENLEFTLPQSTGVAFYLIDKNNSLISNNNFIEGKNYTVILNDITYTVNAWKYFNSNDESIIGTALGNSNLLPSSLLPMDNLSHDVSIPFLIYSIQDDDVFTFYTDRNLIPGNTDCTISITGPAVISHKLDDKYLNGKLIKHGRTSSSEIFNTLNNVASNSFTHAEGMGTTSSGIASHAEGRATTASGMGSHAEGQTTTASASSAHSEGTGTVASGGVSHAEGRSTIAASQFQHVQGKYNIADTSSTYADIVGNGTADNARSNAYTLDWSGNGVYAGKVTVGAAPTANMDVATKQYVDSAIGNINSFDVEVAASTSAVTTPNNHTIYFIPQAVNSSVHDEYMYINNNWELIGTTSVDLSGYLQSSDIAAWAKASTKPSYTAAEVGALPDTTVIPAAQVQSDWNATTGMGVILNKPTIPTVTNTYSASSSDAMSGIAVNSAITTAIGNINPASSDNNTFNTEWEDVYSDWQAGYYYDPDNNYAYTQIPNTEMAWNTTTLYNSVSCTPYSNLIPVIAGEKYRYNNMPVHFDSKNAEIPSIIIFDSTKARIASYTRTFQDEYTEFAIPTGGVWMAVIYANNQAYTLQKQVIKTHFENEILDMIKADYRAYSLTTPPTPRTLDKAYFCFGTDDLRPQETKKLHDMYTTYNIPYYMAAIPQSIKQCITDDPYKTNLDYMRLCVANGGEIVCHGGDDLVITEQNKNDFETMYQCFCKNKEELEHYGFKVRGIFKAGGENAIWDTADPAIDAWATHYFEYGDDYTNYFPYKNERTMAEGWEDYSAMVSAVQDAITNHDYRIFTFHQYDAYSEGGETAEDVIEIILNALSGYTKGVDYDFVTPGQLYDLLMPTTPSSGGGSAVDNNTTYSLSISGNVITLTGSDNLTSSITLPVYNGGVS